MKHTVGVAAMKVSGEPGDIIVTHALGSCLGIAVHDEVAGVGGVLPRGLRRRRGQGPSGGEGGRRSERPGRHQRPLRHR